MINRHAKAIWMLLALGLATEAEATIYNTDASTISTISTYTQYGGGDVIVFLANNSLSASCPYGFWIRATDPGAKTTIAQVLAAQAAGTSVRIWADTAVTWSGAGSAACAVWNIRTSQ